MLAVVALTAATALACGGDEASAVDQEILQAGEDAYVISCARCHQQDGVGYSTIYPALAGSPLVTLEDPRPLIETILEGPGSMPAFRQSLEPEQVAAIATYIRNSWGNEAGPVEAKEVR